MFSAERKATEIVNFWTEWDVFDRKLCINQTKDGLNLFVGNSKQEYWDGNIAKVVIQKSRICISDIGYTKILI